MSTTVHLDEHELAWFFTSIEGAKGRAIFHGCVDTGASFCVLSEANCVNLGLKRKGKTKVTLMTIKGETTAKVYTAPTMKIFGTELEARDVDVVAKHVKGFSLILGMSFLKRFSWCYNKDTNEFKLFK